MVYITDTEAWIDKSNSVYMKAQNLGIIQHIMYHIIQTSSFEYKTGKYLLHGMKVNYN